MIVSIHLSSLNFLRSIPFPYVPNLMPLGSVLELDVGHGEYKLCHLEALPPTPG